MAFAADQYSHFAKVYEECSTDPFVPAHQRVIFAKKAEWYRSLVKLTMKREMRASVVSRLQRIDLEVPPWVRPLR
jgi:hypothetical protein